MLTLFFLTISMIIGTTSSVLLCFDILSQLWWWLSCLFRLRINCGYLKKLFLKIRMQYCLWACCSFVNTGSWLIFRTICSFLKISHQTLLLKYNNISITWSGTEWDSFTEFLSTQKVNIYNNRTQPCILILFSRWVCMFYLFWLN